VRIHLEELSEKIQLFTFFEEPEKFSSLVEINAAGECEFFDPLDIRLGVRRIGRMVAVEGRLSTKVRMSCNRCLKGFVSDLKSRFYLTYTSDMPPQRESEGDDGVELRAEEMGLILFKGEEIDMRDAVQSEIVMAIPIKPLCAEDCQGLCPQCGSDLNEGDCGCKPKSVDPRLAILKRLRIEK
jgi:uncharacterized protein